MIPREGVERYLMHHKFAIIDGEFVIPREGVESGNTGALPGGGELRAPSDPERGS